MAQPGQTFMPGQDDGSTDDQNNGQLPNTNPPAQHPSSPLPVQPRSTEDVKPHPLGQPNQSNPQQPENQSSNDRPPDASPPQPRLPPPPPPGSNPNGGSPPPITPSSGANQAVADRQ